MPAPNNEAFGVYGLYSCCEQTALHIDQGPQEIPYRGRIIKTEDIPRNQFHRSLRRKYNMPANFNQIQPRNA